ncbi:hypothetical protein [Mycobacterium sp.]
MAVQFSQVVARGEQQPFSTSGAVAGGIGPLMPAGNASPGGTVSVVV